MQSGRYLSGLNLAPPEQVVNNIYLFQFAAYQQQTRPGATVGYQLLCVSPYWSKARSKLSRPRWSGVTPDPGRLGLRLKKITVVEASEKDD